MSIDGKNVLAVVPARGGSKGILRKNLRKVSGLSLIGHAAHVVASLTWIDRAILSTDDAAMAEEARRFALDVPFMRPPDIAGDNALSIDVWRHAWLAAEGYYDVRFDLSVLLEPTSPLRVPEDVELTVRTMLDGKHPAAATVSRTPAHFTPEKTLTISERGILGFYVKDGATSSIRQSIPSYYHRNGICYAATREHVVDNHLILESRTAAVVIERAVVNIDEPHELALAERLIEGQHPQEART